MYGVLQSFKSHVHACRHVISAYAQCATNVVAQPFLLKRNKNTKTCLHWGFGLYSMTLCYLLNSNCKWHDCMHRFHALPTMHAAQKMVKDLPSPFVMQRASTATNVTTCSAILAIEQTLDLYNTLPQQWVVNIWSIDRERLIGLFTRRVLR